MYGLCDVQQQLANHNSEGWIYSLALASSPTGHGKRDSPAKRVPSPRQVDPGVPGGSSLHLTDSAYCTFARCLPLRSTPTTSCHFNWDLAHSTVEIDHAALENMITNDYEQ